MAPSRAQVSVAPLLGQVPLMLKALNQFTAAPAMLVNPDPAPAPEASIKLTVPELMPVVVTLLSATVLK